MVQLEKRPALTLGSAPVIYRATSLAALSATEQEAVHALAATAPDAHAFQMPEFAVFAHTGAGEPFIVLAERAGEIAGYWLGFLARYRNLPRRDQAMVRSGPVVRQDLHAFRGELADGFVLAMLEAVRRSGAHKLIVTSETLYGEALDRPLRAAGLGRRELATYLIDLQAPHETLWKAIAGSARRSVRAAERRGVSAKETRRPEDVTAFARVLARTLAEGGLSIPLPSDYADRCLNLIDAGGARLIAGKHGGEVVAGNLIITHGDTALTYHTASGARSLGAGDLVAWRSIEAARAAGHRRLDLLSVAVDPPAGSREAGIRAFKAKWGGALVSTPVYTLRLRESRAGRLVRALAGRSR